MIKMNIANMALGPELTCAALLDVNCAVMAGFNSKTATPEDFQKFSKVMDVLWECCESLEALIANAKAVQAV